MLLLVGCIHKTMTHTHLVIALLKSSGLASQDVVKLDWLFKKNLLES
jgi:hypothetical protein